MNHPFFTLAALSVIASVGVLTLKGKKTKLVIVSFLYDTS
ncbi:hypothetical protein [Streptococcus equi]